MTLAEFELQLMAEGKWDEYAARKREQEETRRRKLEEMARVEAPILQALAGIGIEVKALWQLVNRATEHDAELVPLLLDQFRQPYPDKAREWIAYSLGRPEARRYWDVLLGLYRDEREEHAKDGLAVAIARVATKAHIDDVIGLARDQRNGESRILLLSALARSRNLRVQQTLVDLGKDPQLQKEVQAILDRRRRSKR